MKLSRILVAAAAAEIGSYVVWIVVLIVVGLIFTNPAGTRWFAYLFGQSVGIFSGFLLCILAGRWAARTSDEAIKSGLLVGVVCAALNALIVAVKVAKFPPVLLVGSLGRILGGSVGGWLVQRRRRINNALQTIREDARA